MIDYWRPQVGDRVRVKVNAECPYCIDVRFPDCTAEAYAQDGRTAIVTEIGHDENCCNELDRQEPEYQIHLAHNIWVKWEERRETDDPIIRVGDWECPFDQHYTAAELEPVRDEG